MTGTEHDNRASTSPGSAAGLAAITTADSTLAIVAMDQRGTLRRMYRSAGLPEPTAAEMTSLKADIITALRGSASAFLVDPDYGVPAARAVAGDDPDFGILISAEPAVRDVIDGEPRARRDPEQSAAWVAGMGGHAVKFLVQLRADRDPRPGGPDTRVEVIEVIRAVVADCRAAGIPSVIENLIFPLAGEGSPTPEQRADRIIAAAELIDELGPDLIKLEYPGDAASCRRLAERIHRPWAVLSAGVAFDQFADVVRVACDAGGASGFIAGRSIWKEAVTMGVAERQQFLGGEGRRRLDALRTVIEGRATPISAH